MRTQGHFVIRAIGGNHILRQEFKRRLDEAKEGKPPHFTLFHTFSHHTIRN
jgi:hypothetical protein